MQFVQQTNRTGGAIRGGLVATMAVLAVGTGLCGVAAAKDKPAPSIWEQETLTGDWGGSRTALKNKGIDITLNYIGETFAVLSGGINRAGSYEGRAEFSVDADLEKLIGWTGGTAHVTVFNIHSSRNNVAANVGSIADPSNIDALRPRGCSPPGSSRISPTAFRCAPVNWPPTMSSSPARPPAASSTALSVGPACSPPT